MRLLGGDSQIGRQVHDAQLRNGMVSCGAWSVLGLDAVVLKLEVSEGGNRALATACCEEGQVSGSSYYGILEAVLTQQLQTMGG